MPRWLYSRMVRLGSDVVKLVVEEWNERGLLERLADPLWFQALGCLLGFDWNSSGLTTVTSAALRDSLKEASVGVLAAGGKGSASRTPGEILAAADRLGISSVRTGEIMKASRLAAKVDSATVQDGYSLYHHVVFLSEDGGWAIVQQGMSPEDFMARRYHWFSGSVSSFVREPHKGIIGRTTGRPVLNMVAIESEGARRMSIDAVGDRGILRALARTRTASLEELLWRDRKAYVFPLDSRVDWRTLERLYEVRPRSYEELLMIKGVGSKVVRALALVADLVYGEKPSWRDPVRFSFAHGGKDGVPFPVDRRLYDKTIRELEGIVEAMGSSERKAMLARLRGLVPQR